MLSIVRLKHLVSYVRVAAKAQTLHPSPPTSSTATAATTTAAADEVPLLTRVEAYRAQYGVDY